ncbi:MAG: AAA family ATPase [archaeon]
MSVKMIIGVTGTIGAGKDTVTDYLRDKYGFTVVSMGDIVREELKSTGMQENRENLQFIAKKRTDEFGNGYWARKCAAKIQQLGKEKTAVTGVRRPMDVSIPKKVFGNIYKLIFVDADVELRFKRLKSRKRVGDPKTLAEFKKQELAEWKLFDYEKTAKMADFTVKNEGALEELQKQVDEILKKF